MACANGEHHVQDLLDEMHDSGQPPNSHTCNILLDALCKIQHLDEAIALFQKIVAKGISPDVYICNTLLNGLCKCGRLKTAKEFFQHLLINNYRLNVWTYNIMINGLCKEGLFDEAIALLSKMKGNDCLPDAVSYETLVLALLAGNEKEQTENLLREMINRGLLKGENKVR